VLGSFLLNAVHGGGVEKPSAAGSTPVVPQSLDRQPVGQAAIFNDGNHCDLAALVADERFRNRCFFSMR